LKTNKLKMSFYGPLMGLMLLVLSACASTAPVAEPDPLPGWNAGASRSAIIDFVNDVTDADGPHYVPPAERIAVFDNDGTLWAEKPTYFQLLFVLDRVRAMAADHPEWRSEQPFKAVIENDQEFLHALAPEDAINLLMATHAGMTTDEFDRAARDWLATARHPGTGRPFTEMVYQPMLELLDYLRANEFKTFIVSGGGVNFMRPWTERVYGIPPEQVVGSTIETHFREEAGQVYIDRLPEIHFIDDKEGKPVAIERFIGRRPILAAGNSDGDFQMLQWTTAGEGRRLGLIVHHTDADREWAYDRESLEGRLDRGLEKGPGLGWQIIDMANDWNVVFRPE